jgi:phosphate transport system substrate-binding protein
MDGSPKWPVGEARNRSEDMVETVKTTPGAIGYTELNWALQATLNMAAVRNVAGEFVPPSDASISAAAVTQLSKMEDDFRVALTNGPGAETYPNHQLHMAVRSGSRRGSRPRQRRGRLSELGL